MKMFPLPRNKMGARLDFSQRQLKVHFKATMVLSNMAVDEGQTLEFVLKELNSLRMTIRRATPEEVRDKEDYFGPPNWCEAFTEETVSEKVKGLFENASKIEKEFKPDMVNCGVAPKGHPSVLEVAGRHRLLSDHVGGTGSRTCATPRAAVRIRRG